jgi:hypothetical protein
MAASGEGEDRSAVTPYDESDGDDEQTAEGVPR